MKINIINNIIQHCCIIIYRLLFKYFIFKKYLIYVMVYINNPVDVTLAPGGGVSIAALTAAYNATGGKTFEQAAEINRIYKGNGLPCQKQMCKSITGCDTSGGCEDSPHWKKIQEFCGPAQKFAYMNGAYWVLENADSQQRLLQSTEKRLGLKQLPTPYNVTGMY
jgi:hypothetical protein